MDSPKREPTSNYSQANEPPKYSPSQACPYGQSQAPYSFDQQAGNYPTGQPLTYGQPVQTGLLQNVIVSQPKTTTVPIGDPPPPDYMIPSILVCLFCFFPSGLVAIYFAHRRTSMLAQGNLAEAQKSANIARSLVIMSISAGITWIIIVLVRVVIFTVVVGND